jgi:hypothetical protein
MPDDIRKFNAKTVPLADEADRPLVDALIKAGCTFKQWGSARNIVLWRRKGNVHEEVFPADHRWTHAELVQFLRLCIKSLEWHAVANFKEKVGKL